MPGTIQPARQRPVLERAFENLWRPRPRMTPAHDPRTQEERDSAIDLVRAVRRNDADAVDRLLRQSVDPMCMAPDGTVALVEAVRAGFFPLAKRLVDAGADPRAADRSGVTALGLAWLQANGGPDLDPSIAPKACGEARALLSAWEHRFPATSREDYFSRSFQDDRLGIGAKARLDLESPWAPLSNALQSVDAGSASWATVDSEASLTDLQTFRRARKIPDPDPALGWGRLPTPGRGP